MCIRDRAASRLVRRRLRGRRSGAGGEPRAADGWHPRRLSARQDRGDGARRRRAGRLQFLFDAVHPEARPHPLRLHADRGRRGLRRRRRLEGFRRALHRLLLVRPCPRRRGQTGGVAAGPLRSGARLCPQLDAAMGDSDRYGPALAPTRRGARPRHRPLRRGAAAHGLCRRRVRGPASPRRPCLLHRRAVSPSPASGPTRCRSQCRKPIVCSPR